MTWYDQSAEHFRLRFARQIDSFYYTVFFPDVAFLGINYVGLFIDRAAAPARVTISVDLCVNTHSWRTI